MKRKFKVGKEDSILYKRTFSEKILFGFVFIIFLVYALSLILPFLWLVMNSLQDPLVYNTNLAYNINFEFPKKLVWSNYAYAFENLEYANTNLLGMTFNSIWYTAVSVFGNLLAASMVAYILSKYEFKARNFIYAVIIFCMTVPIVGTTGAHMRLVTQIIPIYNTPLYPILKNFSGMGMNFLVMYGFFKNISWSYAEAAFVDGASDALVFFRIMLPQALAGVVTLGIMSCIGAWNSYMDVLLYLPSFPTIASGLYGVSRVLPRKGLAPVYFAALVLSLIPVFAVFLCFSDLIMQNFAVGGLKG